MEEIEYKLKRNNPIIIAHTIAKILEVIKTKCIEQHSSSTEIRLDIPELQMLRDKCSAPEFSVCLTACQGMVHLVEEGFLTVPNTITDFIAALSSAKNFTGISQGIGELLLYDMKIQLKNSTYSTAFNLISPQHPMITVLRQNANIWPDIVNQMQFLCCHHDPKLSVNSLLLLRPVFIYILCNPNLESSMKCRSEVLNLMLRLSMKKEIQTFIIELLPCLQFNLELKSSFYIDFIETAIIQQNFELCMALLPTLASITHELIASDQDPRPCLNTINNVISNTTLREADNYILLIFCETIMLCPAIYLDNLVRLCSTIVRKKSAHSLVTKILIASFLQWLAYPAQLLNSTLEMMHETIEFLTTTPTMDSTRNQFRLFNNAWFNASQLTETRVHSAGIFLKLADGFANNRKSLAAWLRRINACPVNFIKKVQSLIFGIVISEQSSVEHVESGLNTLLKLVDACHEFATNVLTVLLYKLSRERVPKVQLLLLNAIPQMGVLKENIPMILHTLEALEKGPGGLQSLSIDLYTQLWKIEVRCYPRLHRVLLLPAREKDQALDLEIIKAEALKKICSERPEHHGTELVGLLSSVLNRCVDSNGSLPTSLAIQAITALCIAGVVDIASTWQAIAPKLSKDKRFLVTESLCALLSEIPSLRSPTPAYEALFVEAQTKLWNYITTSGDYKIVNAAIKAISKYDVEQMMLKDIPMVYRQNLKLPSQYAKTPLDATRKPEDILLYVPGECWIQFLQKVHLDNLDGACELLIHWVGIEISAYRSGVYKVPEGQGEPPNYLNLPHKSLVRAFGNYVRSWAMEHQVDGSHRVLIACLRILTQNYEKPLPPINWCFLHELFHLGNEERKYCIILAAKQSINSGSARRFIENYVTTYRNFSENETDIITIYSVLKYLCRSIQPNSLRSFIEQSMTYAFNNCENPRKDDNAPLFAKLLESLTETFLTENIHTANRTLLALQVESCFEQLQSDHYMFPAYSDCAVELPQMNLERMTSPSGWWETTEDKLRKAIEIRCKLAVRKDTTNSLVWLNECIDATMTVPSEQINMLRRLAGILVECREDESAVTWFLEIMGRIQAVMVTKQDSMEEIEFLCDVLMVAVVTLAAYDCMMPTMEMIVISRESRMALLPQATLHLLSNDNWKIAVTETMEFYFHVMSSSAVGEKYRNVFKQSWLPLKFETHFQKPNVWMRYLSKV